MIIFGEFDVKEDGSVQAEFILRGIETKLETAVREGTAGEEFHAADMRRSREHALQAAVSESFQNTLTELRRAVQARKARKVHGLEGGGK